MNKKFEAYITKCEMYFGDILCEYGKASGYDEEQICSGEWQPSNSVVADAMVDCLADHANLTGDDLFDCSHYWFKRDYSRES